VRLNHIREIDKLQLPRRINRILKRNYNQQRKNFSRYLNGQKGEDIFREGKQKKKHLSSKEKPSRGKSRREDFPDGGGHFIDIKV